MSEKFKSRKLLVFIFTALVIISDMVFTLNMPKDALQFLAVTSIGYILGQGYVDAKQQPVTSLPVADITNSIASIIQEELAQTNIGKALPLDEMTAIFKSVLGAELSKINTFTIAPVVSPPGDPIVPII